MSDNFQTFKSKEIKKFLTNLDIRQQFILPASPWWGRFYKRLVCSTKLASLRRSLLKHEELETVLCPAEYAIFLNIFLTYLSLDDLEESLSPFHLMFGRSLSKPSSFSFNCDNAENEHKSGLREKNFGGGENVKLHNRNFFPFVIFVLRTCLMT